MTVASAIVCSTACCVDEEKRVLLLYKSVYDPLLYASVYGAAAEIKTDTSTEIKTVTYQKP